MTGFPWNLIVYSFSKQLELINITSIIGTYGLNLFCISLFTSPAIILLTRTKKTIGVFIFFLFAIVLFYSYGHFKKNKFYEIRNNVYEYKLRVIGSNIGLDRFYKKTDPVSVINDLIILSNPNESEKIIFIWPEGVIANDIEDKSSQIKLLFEKNFSENHLLITGVNKKLINDKYEKFFNSLSVYNNKFELIDTYDKINLVPFGEFLPFENILKILGLKSLTNNYQSFSRGEKRKIIKIEKKNFSLKILPLICYEIIYSGGLKKKSEDFDFILNLSEDGWFGDSIGLNQHFSHSIFRAIEEGKYLIRSANNGSSAYINFNGEVLESIKSTESGVIEVNYYQKTSETLFSSQGNKIFFYFIIFYIILIFFLKKK